MDDSGLFQLKLDQDLIDTIKEILPNLATDNNNNNGNHSHGLKRKENGSRVLTDKNCSSTNNKKMAEGKK